MDDDVRPVFASSKTYIGLYLGIDGTSRNLFGEILHELFRTAAQTVDILTHEASLFHLNNPVSNL
jgi:hypothetical protein